jgi:DNA repair ATPase RecN
MQLTIDATERVAKRAGVAVEAAGHRIRSIEIIGGFLDGARLDFTEGLNCLIGARGAGKTTVIELIRYALDCLPARETQPAERRRIESLVERNLAGGRIRVEIETNEGLAYTVSRTVGEEPIVLTADGQPTEITLKNGGFFRADIFSQNEVESIADRTTSQLELLDNFEAERMAEIGSRLGQVRLQLTANADQITPLQSRIAALAEEIGTLAAVEDRLKKFTADSGDDALAINRAHALKALRDRERRAVTAAAQDLQDFTQELARLNGRLRSPAKPLADREIAGGPNAGIAQEALQQITACGSDVDGLLRQAAERLHAASKHVGAVSAKLGTAHTQQELAFRALIEKHQHAQGQAAERAQLERRRNDLLAKKQLRQQLEEQLATLLADRTALLARLSRLSDERFAVRRSVAERINACLSPAIRVQVVQYGNPERYQRLLEDGLKNARLKHLIVAQRLADRVCPTYLVDAVRRLDTTALAQRADLNTEQAEKVVATLVNSPLLFDLEMVELLDQPRIELKDGANYKDSLSLSTGQKCTAILPILLLDSDNPLIVDQPEDNLDNRFIFEAVVDSIRKVKRRRQLIFVTHNPNIPVLGDAERVFVLDSDGASARKANEGTVDDVKPDIVTLLEGGEDAFKARKCRYAY